MSEREESRVRPLPATMLGVVFLVCASAHPALGEPASGAKGKVDTTKLLQTIDDRLTSPGDLKWLSYWADFEKGEKKPSETIEAVIYRRDKDDALMVLMLGPKTHAGEGYLRLGDNLFLYAPSTGQWSRVTLRERVADSAMRVLDVDSTHFARDFTAKYAGRQKLGNYDAHHVELRAKDGVKVGYARVDLWVDVATGDLLKRVDLSDDEKVTLRTVYFRGWSDHQAKAGERVRLPAEIHFLDNLTGGRTSFYSKKVALGSLERNQFTKAWLESKSR